jgi:hypothetical protein
MAERQAHELNRAFPLALGGEAAKVPDTRGVRTVTRSPWPRQPAHDTGPLPSLGARSFPIADRVGGQITTAEARRTVGNADDQPDPSCAPDRHS